MNSLDQLKQFTTVVADTGDFNQLRAFAPQDATTNPSLILKAVQKDEYRSLLDAVKRDYANASVEAQMDQLIVRFGLEILKCIPGRVSTEVDARLSFNAHATVAKGRELIAHYAKAGIARERVLIKIASTWEGIQAARVLQAEGIRCNMTLLFSLAQAAACADAHAQLISPFVGRIYDWYKKRDGVEYAPQDDPGVVSVRNIYAYYKRHGYTTEVMGASFRNTGQIVALAGCDLLTISPELLAKLQADTTPVSQQLRPELAVQAAARLDSSEERFRFNLNADAMATEKTAEGIRLFAADAEKLEALLRA